MKKQKLLPIFIGIVLILVNFRVIGQNVSIDPTESFGVCPEQESFI